MVAEDHDSALEDRDPRIGPRRKDSGDSDEAKQTVTNLLEEFGWPVVDMGGIESARWLEALSLAWVVYSHRTGKTHHAFKLVGK